MRRGFTLIELIVVIVIVGILAAVGISQYSKMVEKGRSVEVKEIFGELRKFAVAYYLENGTINGMTNSDVNIGAASDQIPISCRSSYYFFYCINVYPSDLYITAQRCRSTGKPPAPNSTYFYSIHYSGSNMAETLSQATGSLPNQTDGCGSLCGCPPL